MSGLPWWHQASNPSKTSKTSLQLTASRLTAHGRCLSHDSCHPLSTQMIAIRILILNATICRLQSSQSVPKMLQGMRPDEHISNAACLSSRYGTARTRWRCARMLSTARLNSMRWVPPVTKCAIRFSDCCLKMDICVSGMASCVTVSITINFYAHLNTLLNPAGIQSRAMYTLAEDLEDEHVTHVDDFKQWLLAAYVAGDELAQICQPFLW